MRGNIRIRNKRWIVSAAALIALMAVANPEGMIIAVSSMLAAGIAGIFLPDMRQYLKPQNKKHDFLTLLIVALAGVSFYFMWQPSSLVTAIAQRIGMTKNAFLALLAMAGSCLACYSVRCVIGAVAAEKWRIKEGERKRVSLYDAGYKTGKKEYLFLFAIAAATITICSKSSPVYPLNDWVDSNCFFTVGKSMLHGKVLYRDIYEQKGFYLYAIHALGYLISNTTFFGIYLFEIGAAFAFLFFAYKTACLYSSNSNVLCTIPILAAVVYGAQAFCHGDSAEEFCLPLLAYALWVGMKAVKNGCLPTRKEYVLVGITSGCILWVKYTMLGFYLGWYAVFFCTMIRKHAWKSIVCSIKLIAVGAAAASLPVILYFLMNSALKDLWQAYFYNNVFIYANRADLANQTSAFANVMRGISSAIQRDGMLSILVLIAILWYWIIGEKSIIALLLGCMAGSMLVFVGEISLVYYAFVFSVFISAILPGMSWVLSSIKLDKRFWVVGG